MQSISDKRVMIGTDIHVGKENRGDEEVIERYGIKKRNQEDR